MRIAIWHNLPSGGGYRAMFDQVRGLTGRGHHVEVWCPESAERDLLPIDSIAEVHRHDLLAPPHGVQRDANPLKAWRRYKNTRYALSQLENHVRRCAAEIDDNGFDVVLAHSSTLFYMHPLARFSKTPAAIYLHEVYRPLQEARPLPPWSAPPDLRRRWSSPYFWRRSLADLLYVQADRVVLREEYRAALEWDRILCNSYFSRESMVRAYGVDARVCYLGVDLVKFCPGSDVRSDYLVGLGGLRAAKGAHLAVMAVGQVPKAIRPALRWVGDASDHAYLKLCAQLAHDLDVDFSLEVRVGEDVLLGRLQNAIALIYPVVLEPFGFAPLEAIACGTPVIGIAEGGVRETVVDGFNGFLVPTRQPEKWAHAIMALVENPQLGLQLGKQGRTKLSDFWSLQAATSRLEKELFEVVASGRKMMV